MSQDNQYFDVAVIGAGSAGVAAAVSAAEQGARTILLEASGTVGGTLAWQLLEHSAGFHDVAGNQVIAGFGDRLVQRLAALGSSPGHVRDDVGYTATRTPLNHVELALVEMTMLGDSGATLWLNAPVVDTSRQDDRITRLTVETPAGRRQIEATMVVDTSGDAVVAQQAGAEFQPDMAQARQPASLTFKLGGIDFTELLAYARATPNDFRPGSVVGDAGSDHCNLWGFGDLLAQGREQDLLGLHRTELHLAGWPRRGEAVVNVSRVTMGEQDTNWTGEAAIALARQVMEFARWFRAMVPGCGQAYVAAIADRVGVRESRRVLGLTTLTPERMKESAEAEDVIALSAFPIDIHESDSPTLSHTQQLDKAYGVPYGCLVAAGFSNLLMAGRCISSTHEANGSVRITASCFATGEAAGTAAAMAARSGVAAGELNIGDLRRHLQERGVILATA